MDKSKTTPTARTTAWLRKKGFVYDIVEQDRSFQKKERSKFKRVNYKKDFLGVIDVISIMTVGEYFRIVGIQATGGEAKSNANARKRKAEQEPRLKSWLAAGGLFEVWWWQPIENGDRNRWVCHRSRAEMTGGEITWTDVLDCVTAARRPHANRKRIHASHGDVGEVGKEAIRVGDADTQDSRALPHEQRDSQADS